MGKSCKSTLEIILGHRYIQTVTVSIKLFN